MHCWMWECALSLLRVEVLDKGRKGVQLRACRIPADEHLLWRGLQVQLEHALLVVHIHLDLLGSLCVGHGVAVANLDFGAIFASRSEKCANNALLLCWSAGCVVEDAEECLWLDVDGDGGGVRGLGGDCGGRKWPREVQETVVAHLRGCCQSM